jgi:branched-chain amino acid transport system permease protein
MAIGTLGFAIAVFLIADRFRDLTGGEDGVRVPAMVLFGEPMGGTFYHYVILFFVVLTYAFCYFLADSRIGLALKSLGENEDAAAAMGIDIVHYKRLSWLISAVFGGLAGTLYAQQAGFLSPSTFALWTNIIALVILLVGGLGLNFGVVIGSTIMTLLPHVFAGFENFVLLLNGLILFLVLRFLPDGVLGTAMKVLEKRKRSKGPLGMAAETF